MPATQPWTVHGRVATGVGRARHFTALDWFRQQLCAALGIDPHPGTLNLRLERSAVAAWRRVRGDPGVRLTAPAGGCGAWCLPVTIAGSVTGAAIVPEIGGYAPDQVEVVAALHLRHHLGLQDGDPVALEAAEPPPLRAVIFDVDGTLVNSIDGMWLAVSRAAALYGFEVPADAVRRSLNHGGSVWEAIIPPEARGDPQLPAVLRAEALRQWPRVLEESVEVFAGLAATLEALRARGLRLAICTGSRGESFRALERAGLLDQFAPVVTAADVARAKPHPEGLERCLELLGCAPGEAAYVGDSRHDMEAGRAAGLFTVGVLTGAADPALLSGAGAHRLAATHAALPSVLLPGVAAAG